MSAALDVLAWAILAVPTPLSHGAPPPVVQFQAPAESDPRLRAGTSLVVRMTVRAQSSVWRSFYGHMLRRPTWNCREDCQATLFRAWWPYAVVESDVRWTREKDTVAGAIDTMEVPAPPWSVPTLRDTMYVEIQVGVRAFGGVRWGPAIGLTVGQ